MLFSSVIAARKWGRCLESATCVNVDRSQSSSDSNKECAAASSPPAASPPELVVLKVPPSRRAYCHLAYFLGRELIASVLTRGQPGEMATSYSPQQATIDWSGCSSKAALLQQFVGSSTMSASSSESVCHCMPVAAPRETQVDAVDEDKANMAHVVWTTRRRVRGCRFLGTGSDVQWTLGVLRVPKGRTSFR